MSAGFEFAKKHEITICGRAYPCDISDKRMLEGVTRDFPRVLQAAQAFCAMDAKLKPGGQDGRSADTMAQEALEKFSDAVAMCRAFIEGTLGVEEYREIFGGRPENINEHISLCAYIYGEVMGGRREVVEQFLIPELKEAVANVSGNSGAAGPDPWPKGADGLGLVDEVCGNGAGV